MSDLSPELHKMVLAGRAASCPTPADFDRVATALEARLGDVVLPRSEVASGIGSSAGVPVASGKVAGLAALGIALVIGGVVLYLSRYREATGSPLAQATLSAVSVVEPPQPVISHGLVVHSAAAEKTTAETTMEATPLSASARSPGGGRVRQRERAPNRFAEEVTLMSRAEAELHRGRAGKALELLGEHERRFAGGALSEERVAARVQALCALGRVNEADAQLARLNPGSMHGESSRNACKTSSATKVRSVPSR